MSKFEVAEPIINTPFDRPTHLWSGRSERTNGIAQATNPIAHRQHHRSGF
jgi:hypothetical protein